MLFPQITFIIALCLVDSKYELLDDKSYAVRQEATKCLSESLPPGNLELLSFFFAKSRSAEQQYRIFSILKYRIYHRENPRYVLSIKDEFIQQTVGKHQDYLRQYLEIRGVVFNDNHDDYLRASVTEPISIDDLTLLKEMTIIEVCLSGPSINNEHVAALANGSFAALVIDGANVDSNVFDLFPSVLDTTSVQFKNCKGLVDPASIKNYFARLEGKSGDPWIEPPVKQISTVELNQCGYYIADLMDIGSVIKDNVRFNFYPLIPELGVYISEPTQYAGRNWIHINGIKGGFGIPDKVEVGAKINFVPKYYDEILEVNGFPVEKLIDIWVAIEKIPADVNTVKFKIRRSGYLVDWENIEYDVQILSHPTR